MNNSVVRQEEESVSIWKKLKHFFRFWRIKV